MLYSNNHDSYRKKQSRRKVNAVACCIRFRQANLNILATSPKAAGFQYNTTNTRPVSPHYVHEWLGSDDFKPYRDPRNTVIT